MTNFEKRLAKQNSFCRGCDEQQIKGEDEIIYTYSFRNRGQSIIFCMKCAKEIGELSKSEEN